ncbi:MAG: protein YgfX [bacterium]
MSISTSVVVRPSTYLSLALLAMGMLLLTCAAMLATSATDETALVFRQLLIVLCVVAAIYSFLSRARFRTIFIIDISASGVIRLRHTEQAALTQSTVQISDLQERGEIVQLQRDSTLWSMLLLLRFQSGNGLLHTVIVLPDSLDDASFRALTIACHWIASQGAETQT